MTENQTYTVDGRQYATLWEALAAPLRADQIEIRKERGGIPYMKWTAVVERLETVAPGDWHWSNLRHESTAPDGSQFWVVGLTVAGVYREGCGIGEPLMQSDGVANFTAYGGPGKKAATDAKKRAAMEFGIGRELRMDTEAALDKATGQVVTPSSPSPLPARPYDPQTLFDVLQKGIAAKNNNQPATQEQKGYIAAMLGEAIGEGGTEKDRYLLTAFLRADGQESTKAFTFGEALTWLNWLVDPDTKGLNPLAGDEARRALKEARIAAGQLELPLSESETAA